MKTLMHEIGKSARAGRVMRTLSIVGLYAMGVLILALQLRSIVL